MNVITYDLSTIDYSPPALLNYKNVHDFYYYVVSNEDNVPTQMFFNYSEAFNGDHVFVDVFDIEGCKLASFMNVDGVWTDDY